MAAVCMTRSGDVLLAVDHVPQQDFEAPDALGLAQAHQLLHAQHHFLLADLRIYRLEGQRHGRARLRRRLPRHRMQRLGNLGGDVGENGLHRGSEKSRGRILVFGRRVLDDDQAHALQRGVQVAQRQHHCRTGTLAAQET